MRQENYHDALIVHHPNPEIPNPQILPTIRWRQLAKNPLIVLAGFLILFFLAVEVLFLSLSRSASLAAYQDPFTAYVDILPGRSVRGLDKYWCKFEDLEIARMKEGVCDLHSEHGAFYWLNVVIQGGKIRGETFYARGLRIGDLVHPCGRIAVAAIDRKAETGRWLQFGDCTIFVQSGAFSYLLPVQYVILARKEDL